MSLRDVSLHDKYDLGKDRVLLNGTQALVRLMLMQRARDGRRGSIPRATSRAIAARPSAPSTSRWRRRGRTSRPPHVKFHPGLNEDLAATAALGHPAGGTAGRGASTTASSASGTARARASTARATSSATPTWPAPRRTAASSSPWATTTPAKAPPSATSPTGRWSTPTSPSCRPAGVQEILDYGLYGIAMSRFAGVWAGLKLMKDTVEVDLHHRRPRGPDDVRHARLPDARRRAQHPARRSLDHAGSADDRPQALRRGSLCPREQNRQAHVGQAGREDRLRRGGQELARPRPCHVAPRDRRGARPNASASRSTRSARPSRWTWPPSTNGPKGST